MGVEKQKKIEENPLQIHKFQNVDMLLFSQ